MKIVDGIAYQDDEAPDLGSIECIETDDRKRNYQLLSADVDKLNTIITYVGAGSSALVLDTGEVYMFHEKSTTWYKL